MPQELNTQSSIAEWDYLAPLDHLSTLPTIPELQRLYSSDIRRARFIHALCQGHTATWAARYGGNSREQFYAWKNEYPDFAAAWQNAVDGAAGDIWEDRLLAISQSDKNPGAVTATIVGLKIKRRFVEASQPQQQAVQIQVITVHVPGQPDAQQISVAPSIPLIEAPGQQPPQIP